MPIWSREKDTVPHLEIRYPEARTFVSGARDLACSRYMDDAR
jgi:hypothetical protein